MAIGFEISRALYHIENLTTKVSDEVETNEILII
jgi:hypothetical protein